MILTCEKAHSSMLWNVFCPSFSFFFFPCPCHCFQQLWLCQNLLYMLLFFFPSIDGSTPLPTIRNTGRVCKSELSIRRQQLMSNQSKLNGKLMSSLCELTSFLYKQGQSIYNPAHFMKHTPSTQVYLCCGIHDLPAWSRCQISLGNHKPSWISTGTVLI